MAASYSAVLAAALCEALLGQLARALGGLVALVQHLLQGLEEDALQIEVQQNHQQKGRHCSQQYSAQLVQHGIHDFKERQGKFLKEIEYHRSKSTVNRTLRWCLPSTPLPPIDFFHGVVQHWQVPPDFSHRQAPL